LLTTTWGTGELIRHALDAGVQQIIIGIGGSATNDGGAGMVQALGGKLLTADNQQIASGGGRWNSWRASI
jgi:glycerate kinase